MSIVTHLGRSAVLGKRAARHDKRTLQLAKYLTGSLPKAPQAKAWSRGTNRRWPMYLNDKIGDCTCATAAHMIENWTANGQKNEIEVKDDDVLTFYKLFGYDGTEATDNGAVELDVLKAWKKTGLAGHKIGGFASVSPTSSTIVKDGVFLFGGLYAGFSLPLSAQDQHVWDIPVGGLTGDGAPGSWGGHAVPIIDYDARGLTCVTWGGLQRMTWAFLHAFCDEAYALISPDFLKGGLAPSGFDLKTLQADLKLLGH